MRHAGFDAIRVTDHSMPSQAASFDEVEPQSSLASPPGMILAAIRPEDASALRARLQRAVEVTGPDPAWSCRA